MSKIEKGILSPRAQLNLYFGRDLKKSIHILFHGEGTRTAFLHELVMYQKSSERVQRTREISDTSTF